MFLLGMQNINTPNISCSVAAEVSEFQKKCWAFPPASAWKWFGQFADVPKSSLTSHWKQFFAKKKNASSSGLWSIWVVLHCLKCSPGSRCHHFPKKVVKLLLDDDKPYLYYLKNGETRCQIMVDPPSGLCWCHTMAHNKGIHSPTWVLGFASSTRCLQDQHVLFPPKWWFVSWWWKPSHGINSNL